MYKFKKVFIKYTIIIYTGTSISQTPVSLIFLFNTDHSALCAGYYFLYIKIDSTLDHYLLFTGATAYNDLVI